MILEIVKRESPVLKYYVAFREDYDTPVAWWRIVKDINSLLRIMPFLLEAIEASDKGIEGIPAIFSLPNPVE